MTSENLTPRRTRRPRKPDGIYERRNSDGSISYLAQVRLKGFKPVAKAFANRQDARTWRANLETELRKQRENGATRADLPSLTTKGLIEEFLADPETRQLKYLADLELLLAWWVNRYGAEKVLSLGTLKLREARELLRNGRAPATTNRYLSALRSAWNWGRASGLVPQEKVWPTRLMLTEPRERVRFLSDSELARLLEQAKEHSAWMHAAVVVSIATGIRQGELLRLEWRDLELAKGTLTVHVSKSGKRRLVHLNAPAAAALENLRRSGVVGARRVFVTEDGTPVDKSYLLHRWRSIRDAAELKDFRWHDLRHTTASFLAQNGASLVEIGSVLGHSSPSITSKYAHLVAGAPVTGAEQLARKLTGIR